MQIFGKMKALKIRQIGKIAIAFVFFSGMLSCIISLTRINEIVGIGLPAPMETFVGEHAGFSIKYPQSWQAHETPQGNHGDLEVIGVVSRLGRSFPTVTIARHQFVGDEINLVAEWGEARVKEQNPYAVYKFIATKQLNTDNYNGLSHEYHLEETALSGQVVRHCQDWYLIEKSVGYSLSFCVHDEGWTQVEGIFQEMIQSFVVTGD